MVRNGLVANETVEHQRTQIVNLDAGCKLLCTVVGDKNGELDAVRVDEQDDLNDDEGNDCKGVEWGMN